MGEDQLRFAQVFKKAYPIGIWLLPEGVTVRGAVIESREVNLDNVSEDTNRAVHQLLIPGVSGLVAAIAFVSHF